MSDESEELDRMVSDPFWRCPVCDDSVFVPVMGITFEKDDGDLNRKYPGKPKPVQLMKCLSCEGYLMKQKEGGFAVVRRDPHGKDKPPSPLLKTQPVAIDPKAMGGNNNVVRGPW